jgi:hypothetical protein
MLVGQFTRGATAPLALVEAGATPVPGSLTRKIAGFYRPQGLTVTMRTAPGCASTRRARPLHDGQPAVPQRRNRRARPPSDRTEGWEMSPWLGRTPGSEVGTYTLRRACCATPFSCPTTRSSADDAARRACPAAHRPGLPHRNRLDAARRPWPASTAPARKEPSPPSCRSLLRGTTSRRTPYRVLGSCFVRGCRVKGVMDACCGERKAQSVPRWVGRTRRFGGRSCPCDGDSVVVELEQVVGRCH